MSKKKQQKKQYTADEIAKKSKWIRQTVRDARRSAEELGFPQSEMDFLADGLREGFHIEGLLYDQLERVSETRLAAGTLPAEIMAKLEAALAELGVKPVGTVQP